MVEGKMEGLEIAAKREVQEETGIVVTKAEKLCTYQASLIHKSKGYFICFFACQSENKEISSAREALLGVCKKECEAAALIPEELLLNGIFSPELCSGMDSKEAAKRARCMGYGTFDGVTVEGDDIKSKRFEVEEIVGDGGEGVKGGGIGIAHRWGSECYKLKFDV